MIHEPSTERPISLEQLVPYIPRHNRASGSGSISINPSGTFKAQITVTSRIGGKATRLTKSFRTKRMAEDWLHERRKEIDGGMTSESLKSTFGDFFNHWIELKRMALGPRTLDDYQRLGRLYLLPRFAGESLRQIRTAQINDFYSSLEAGGVGSPTIDYIHRVLRAVLNQAQREGVLFANPCRYSIRPKVEKKRNTYGMSEQEIHDFLSRAADTPHAALLFTALQSGMRLGELLGLTWRDVDFPARRFHVHHQIPSRYVKGRQRRHEKTKTTSSHREIPISVELIQVLSAHQSFQQIHKTLMGSRWKEHDLVFPSSIGTPLQPSVPQKECRRIFQEMGLPDLTFHALRHACASLLIKRGMSLFGTSQYLGHSSTATTSSTYAHLLPGGLEKAASIFDEFLTDGAGNTY